MPSSERSSFRNKQRSRCLAVAFYTATRTVDAPIDEFPRAFIVEATTSEKWSLGNGRNQERRMLSLQDAEPE